jgi:hypothetical protein
MTFRSCAGLDSQLAARPFRAAGPTKLACFSDLVLSHTSSSVDLDSSSLQVHECCSRQTHVSTTDGLAEIAVKMLTAFSLQWVALHFMQAATKPKRDQ